MKCMLFILSLWHFLGHFFSHNFNLIHFSSLLRNVLLFHWVKELLKARVRKRPFPPTTLWFCGLLWWFVMISMDDNIQVFRPCSPGFLARGLCEVSHVARCCTFCDQVRLIWIHDQLCDLITLLSKLVHDKIPAHNYKLS